MEKSVINQYLAGMTDVTNLYPVKISSHYRNLLREEGDPLWRQCMPTPKELENPDSLSEDGLGENPQSPCPRFIHRYPDRGVLVATNCCFTYCRFCFRKRFWKNGEKEKSITDGELSAILCYLGKHHEIKDILFSGGDPLTLPDDRIVEILEKLFAAGEVETVRLCSRAPVFEPSRITEDLAEKLGRFPALWFVTHFNHPDELTDESLAACRRLQLRGIPVLNQTVLLKGVNNDAKSLIKLFRGLAKSQIKAHYLFHADPIRGTAHFATGIEEGLELLKIFRRELSSIATPFFAIDLPDGGGKVCLQPDYSAGETGAYKTIEGKTVVHPLV